MGWTNTTHWNRREYVHNFSKKIGEEGEQKIEV